MDNLKLYLLIYELKGIVSSMESTMNDNDEYYHPLMEDVASKVDGIIEVMKQGNEVNTYATK